MYGLGLLRGLWITLVNFIRSPITEQYPDRKVGLIGAASHVEMNPLKFALNRPGEALRASVGMATVKTSVKQAGRFRGQDFNWYEERCTGCASCAKFCPLGIIKIVTDTSGKLTQDGEIYDIDVFDIDLGRCMYCGICVEVCPYDALHMGSGFERAHLEREKLVIPVEELRKKKKTPSTWFRPQLEQAGYNPLNGDEREWDKAGRHEQPSKDELKHNWVDSR